MVLLIYYNILFLTGHPLSAASWSRSPTPADTQYAPHATALAFSLVVFLTTPLTSPVSQYIGRFCARTRSIGSTALPPDDPPLNKYWSIHDNFPQRRRDFRYYQLIVRLSFVSDVPLDPELPGQLVHALVFLLHLIVLTDQARTLLSLSATTFHESRFFNGFVRRRLLGSRFFASAGCGFSCGLNGRRPIGDYEGAVVCACTLRVTVEIKRYIHTTYPPSAS